jgi:hypothetical protein
MIAEMDPETRRKFEFVAQAIIKRLPAFFSAQGIKFQIGLDDLNAYQVAELTSDDLTPRHHQDNPGGPWSPHGCACMAPGAG